MKKLIRKAVLLTTILSLSFCISIWAANRTLVSQQVYTDENGEQMRSLKYSDGSTDEFDLTVDDYLVSEKDENGIRYSTYANGDTSNVYIDQINEYSSFTKQYGPIIKGCDFAKDENGQKIVDADGSRYISKIRFMEKAGGGEIALDKSEYLKVGKYDHFRLIALKYSIPIRFKDGIYTEWMADRDNGFKGKLIKVETDEKYEKEYAKEREAQEKEDAILDKYKKAQNFEKSSNHIDFLKYREQKVIELRDNLNARVKELSLQSIEDLHNIRASVQKYQKQKGQGWSYVLEDIDKSYGTNDDSWDEVFKNALRKRGGKMRYYDEKYKTTLMVIPTKDIVTITKKNTDEKIDKTWAYKFECIPGPFSMKSAHGYLLTNENYDKFESEAITMIKNCYEDVRNKFPNMTSFEHANLAQKIGSYLKHYGTEADAYILDLVESTAVSEEDKKELEKLKKEAEELEQELRGSDSWGN